MPAQPTPRDPRPLRLAALLAVAALLLAGQTLPERLVEAQSRLGANSLAAGAVVLAALALLIVLEQLRREADTAHLLARQDPRTGLANEAECRERLAEALSLANRQGWHVGVMVLNLRGFRAVNEAFGRSAGDTVLSVTGCRLRAMVRREDTVARLGADRFAVIQTAIAQPDGVTRLAARLAGELARPFPIGTRQVECPADIGLAIAPADGIEAGLLIGRAEAALAAARSGSGPGIALFDPVRDTALRRRHSLEAELHDAVAEGHFLLRWQPQRRLSDSRLLGFEALLRWDHPTRGLIPPGDFIALAETTGLIVPLGAWALRTACAEAAGWPGRFGIAVNISPAQFGHRGLPETVADALSASGLAPARLELEVTESLLQGDLASTAMLLEKLRALGIGIAMDDFGTGYSSLAHLGRLPFTKLKIDRAFLMDLPGDHRAAAILEATIGLGRNLGLTMVAEGIETEAQAAWLLDHGCDQGQGWLLGRPMTATAARALVGKELAAEGHRRSAA